MCAAEVLQRVHALLAVFVVRMRFERMLMVVLVAAAAIVIVMMLMVVFMATGAGFLVVMVLVATAAIVIVMMLVLMTAGAGFLMVLMVMMMLVFTTARRGVGMLCVIFNGFCMHVGMHNVFGRRCGPAGFFECHKDGLLIYI